MDFKKFFIALLSMLLVAASSSRLYAAADCSDLESLKSRLTNGDFKSTEDLVATKKRLFSCSPRIFGLGLVDLNLERTALGAASAMYGHRYANLATEPRTTTSGLHFSCDGLWKDGPMDWRSDLGRPMTSWTEQDFTEFAACVTDYRKLADDETKFFAAHPEFSDGYSVSNALSGAFQNEHHIAELREQSKRAQDEQIRIQRKQAELQDVEKKMNDCMHTASHVRSEAEAQIIAANTTIEFAKRHLDFERQVAKESGISNLTALHNFTAMQVSSRRTLAAYYKIYRENGGKQSIQSIAQENDPCVGDSISSSR